MSTEETIEKPYKIHEGFLHPSKWEKNAVYIARRKEPVCPSCDGWEGMFSVVDGMVYCLETRKTAFTTEEYYNKFKDDFTHTIGPIYLSGVIPEPPPMLNRWVCYSPIEKRWLTGYVDAGERYPLQVLHQTVADTRMVEGEKIGLDYSTFKCDDYGSVPVTLRNEIYKAKGI